MHYDVREPLRAEEANRICHACARPRKRNFVIGTLLDTGLRVSEPCSMATPGSVATRVAVRQRKGRSLWQAVKGEKESCRCLGRRASNSGLNFSGASCKNPLYERFFQCSSPKQSIPSRASAYPLREAKYRNDSSIHPCLRATNPGP